MVNITDGTNDKMHTGYLIFKHGTTRACHPVGGSTDLQMHVPSSYGMGEAAQSSIQFKAGSSALHAVLVCLGARGSRHQRVQVTDRYGLGVAQQHVLLVCSVLWCTTLGWSSCFLVLFLCYLNNVQNQPCCSSTPVLHAQRLHTDLLRIWSWHHTCAAS